MLQSYAIQFKDVGTTYQRMGDKVFQHQNGLNVEVYIDDMVIKTTKENPHINDLGETFQTLTKYQLKLNSQNAFLEFTLETFGFYDDRERDQRKS